VNSDSVVDELRKANHLLALILVKGMPQRAAITALDAIKFTPKQIAAALGITANAASVALHRIRKAADKTTGLAEEHD
jgi:DNA-directed RNA polymerase specialized sigma24 family protein